MTKPKPSHYRMLCISMYTRDIERCDELVTELRARGLTKMSRSELVRIALAQVDVDRIAAAPKVLP